MSKTSSDDEWVQFYRECTHGEGEGGQWSSVHRAQNNIGVSKPRSRRSRASRKAPTTLLNANTTNFRDLVQQFTGFQAAGAALPLGSQRGPINLSFSQSAPDISSSVVTGGFSFTDTTHHCRRQILSSSQPQPEGQPFVYPSSFQNSSSDIGNTRPTNSTITNQFMEIQHELGVHHLSIDQDFSLMDELTLEFSSSIANDNNNNGGYFL